MRILKPISILVFTILSTTLSNAAPRSPLSEYSALIARLQKTYATNQTEYPIYILDRNELEWEIAKNRLFGEAQRKNRIAFLEQYFERKLNRDVTFHDAVNIETYVTILIDSAFALRLYDDNYQPKACLVFPTSENSNQFLETERILGLTTANVYGSLGYNNLKTKLSYEELRLLSILHEIGHCLDRKFVPQSIYAGGESSHDVHLSESFAETFATLAMVREGYSNLAMKRARLRTIYSRIVGPYLASNPQLGLGSPTVMDGGIIYHLYPVLRAAHFEIKASQAWLGSANIPTLIEIAERIVDKNAIPHRTFAALTYMMKHGSEAAVARYEEMAKTSPEFFLEALNGLKNYIAVTDRILEKAFDPQAKAPESRGDLTPLNLARLCEYLNAKNTHAFFTEVNRYRSELRSGYGTPEEQRARAKDLNWLMANVAESCEPTAAGGRL